MDVVVKLQTLDAGAALGVPAGSPPPLRLRNYIGGAFVDAAGGGTIDDVNPATGGVIAAVPRSGAADVDAAVSAAAAAFPSWRDTPAVARAALLEKVADALEAHLPALALMESQDAGKTLRMATAVDIPRAVANFRFFAGAVRHDATQAFEMADAVNYTTRVPLGVVAAITPWNLPLYLLSWKVAPALACGNTIVVKPSEVTPRTASALADIIHAVGLPPGVFNLVHGLGGEAGGPLVAHPRVRLVSFTGGTVTGKAVAAAAAPLFKKLSLELGGKNATIIFADAGVDAAPTPGGVDFGKTVAGALRSAFTNNGQVCLAGSRLFVQRPLYARFLAAFVEAAARMVVGNPQDASTDVGAVSSAAHRDKILSYIALAREEGGKVECGGFPSPPDGSGSSGQPELRGTPYEGGYFVAPTVISGLDWRSSRVANEEIFGPVVTVHPFDTAEEAVEAANVTPYGLAGSIWTNDLGTAHRVARRVESGLLWVNCWLHRDLRTPFGGVKASGTGREGGAFSLEAYSEWKNVCVHIGAP